MIVTRIRAGLYSVVVNGHEYTVEDRHDGRRWVWRLSDPSNFFDSWVDDFDTKREALKHLAGMVS